MTDDMTLREYSGAMRKTIQQNEARDPEGFGHFEDGVRTALMFVDDGVKSFGAIRTMRVVRRLRNDLWKETPVVVGFDPRAETLKELNR